MRKFLLPVIALVMLSAVVAACAQQPTPVVQTQTIEVTRVVEVSKEVTKVVTEKVEVVVTATPEPVEAPKQLIVCMAQEPDTLLYDVVGGTSALVKTAILYTVQDPVITNLTYAYQAGPILEELPTLENGGAEVIDVEVTEGMQVQDPVSGEVVTYTGAPTTMQAIRVTFKFKKGLTWEDGQPLTAHDSVLAYELGKRPDSQVASRFTYDRTASYEATDDQTVVWTGIPGFMDPTYNTNVWTPVPSQELEGLTPDEIRANEKFARSPLSYGPYSLRLPGAEWVAGDHVTAVKNPNYWRADQGLPAFEAVTYKFIPDTNQLLAQMLAGECDIITQDGALENQAPFLKQAEEQGLVKPFFVTGTVWEHIDFQIDPGDQRPALGRCFPVRKAMTMGTDRQSVVDQVLFGESKVLHTFIPEEHPFYNPDVPKYEFDPEGAKQLLEESGWVDSDGDGIREASGVSCEWVNWRTKETETYQVPDGTKLSLTLNTTAGNKLREQVTQIFQANMKEIGVEVKLEYLPAGVYFGDPPDGPLFSRKYDLAEFAWLSGVEPGGNLYQCTGVPDESNGWSGQNNTGWCSPAFDAASNAAMSSLEEDVRRENWYKAQEALEGEQGLPFIPMFQRLKIAATRPDLTGFVMDPTENSEMFNLAEFKIEQ